ncbi:uncharacterized protein [Atheta coriaria]|uniref:uncharacterized protein n=1 Tax=Dalotia coriaria TaxID=877792 RepID=UPI0031F3D307
MFANSFQSGFLSIFYSVGSSPLGIWDKSVKNGHIRRIVDEEVKSLVLEIAGTNVATTYITCPIKPRASLGIKLPFLVMVVKNMKKYFTFEIQIVDDKDMRRRFRVSNFQSTTKVRPFCTTMPIGLSSGWNQIQFNLADFTRRAYGTVYMETIRVQVHANVRIRRIYFSDRLYAEEELPSEYKLFMPLQKSQEKSKGKPKDRASKDSKDAKDQKKSVTGSAQMIPKVLEEPSGAPPTPAEPADVEDGVEEKELRASSVAPVVGDLPTVEEIEGDEVEAAAEMLSATAVPVEGENAEGEKPAEEVEGGELPEVAEEENVAEPGAEDEAPTAGDVPPPAEEDAEAAEEGEIAQAAEEGGE